MSDPLLRGLKQIHEVALAGLDGKPVIPFRRFCKDYSKDLRAKGVIFELGLMGSPPNRTKPVFCWLSAIKNYFMALGQKNEELKRLAKLKKPPA